MKHTILFLMLISSLVTTRLLAQSDLRGHIYYQLPESVKEKLAEQLDQSITKEKQTMLFYCYYRMHGDTVVIVLSHCYKNKPTKLYNEIVFRSNRFFKINNMELPILLESDITMSSSFVEFKGDNIESNTILIPKGLEIIYEIQKDGHCRIISTGISQ